MNEETIMCWQCDNLATYEYDNDYWCADCLDDELCEAFRDNYSIRDKADVLGVEVKEI